MNKILHYLFFCHRLPERSFHYKGRQFPICARCTGILLGYFLGIAYIILFKSPNIYLEVILMLPLVIDGTLQLLTPWTSNNIRRVLTGILAGISFISLIRISIILGFNGVGHILNYL